MAEDRDRQAITDLIDRTYHRDHAAIKRFMENPHQLLSGRSPNQVVGTGPDGILEVAALLRRANSGFAV
jgi:uncharacterized protein (DUF2384 family)